MDAAADADADADGEIRFSMTDTSNVSGLYRTVHCSNGIISEGAGNGGRVVEAGERGEYGRYI